MAATAKGTPGRRRKTTNQFFSPGKVGRKTGVILKDTGIRDEYGMEPMDIFSSPEKDSPKRKTRGANGDRTLSSSDMAMQESSAPEPTEVLTSRKTPRLPPPRASTPKHTNIGSPKRHSSVRPQSRGQSMPAAPSSGGRPTGRGESQPPANRLLDFGNSVRRSIESLSPFKPKVTLRRSLGTARKDPFSLEESPDNDVQTNGALTEVEDELQEDAPAFEDDYQPLLDNDDSLHVHTLHEDTVTAHALPKRRPGRLRKSDESMVQHSPPATQTIYEAAAKKGRRASLEPQTNGEEVNGDASVSQLDNSTAGPAQKKRRGRPPKNKQVILHEDEGEATINPQQLAHGDEYLADGAGDDGLQPEPEPTKKGKKGGRTGKAPLKDKSTNSKVKNVRATGSPVKLKDSPSKLRQTLSPSKRNSVGPISNVNLRASTPFEDAGPRVSRFGRPIMDPLKFWQNESLIWKDGQIEGVVRAQEVEVLKGKSGRRKTKGRKRKIASAVDIVYEDSETESVMPEDWEDKIGVISGMVAGWDPDQSTGDLESEIREDLAFASTSITTREIVGSAFRYAKIMTLPFFGCGVVELPPEGYKRAKNSRKMHMAFFVHEGKVLVQVGPVGSEGNEFAISTGGVWVVPRGNNYAITNMSSTTMAHVFFAQGCEIDPGKGEANTTVA